MMRSPRRLLADQRGVSLLEQMVALASSGIILVGMTTLWYESQRAYFDATEAAVVQQDLRTALERLTRVVQAAGANPTNQTYNGSVPNDPAFVAFREAGPQCLRLYADLDGNGTVTGPDENVSFRIGVAGDPVLESSGAGPDAGHPWVGTGSSPQDLALGIIPNPSNVPVFQFFTGPNDAAPNTPLPAAAGCAMLDAARSRIARVVITLTARGSTGSRSFTRTLVSEARPRNVP